MVLILVDPPSAVVRWLLAVGTPVIAGLLISRLLGQLRLGVHDAERRTRALQESEARTRLVLDGAPDAFVSLDRDGVIKAWNSAAERLFGWSASEAIGVPFRSLVTPEEFRERHDQRRTALIDVPQVVAMQRYDTEFVRRDGTRFPAEATVSKIEIKGEPFISGFIRDVSERERRQRERETLLREQAARAEAERVAELVSGMQLLVDAALQNPTLDKILDDLMTRVRGVLQADAATILLADEDGRLSVAASSVPGASEDEEAGATRANRAGGGVRRPGGAGARGHVGGRPRGSRPAGPGAGAARGRLADRGAAARREQGHRGAGRGLGRATALLLRGPRRAPPGRRPRRARDPARAPLRARAPDRGDAAAQHAAGRGRHPAGTRAAAWLRVTSPRPRRPTWAATGTT